MIGMMRMIKERDSPRKAIARPLITLLRIPASDTYHVAWNSNSLKFLETHVFDSYITALSPPPGRRERTGSPAKRCAGSSTSTTAKDSAGRGAARRTNPKVSSAPAP
jgi:hypothetical protein